jgi:hypothetical protein
MLSFTTASQLLNEHFLLKPDPWGSYSCPQHLPSSLRSQLDKLDKSLKSCTSEDARFLRQQYQMLIAVSHHSRGDLKPSECGSGGLHSDYPVHSTSSRVVNRLDMYEMWTRGHEMWDSNLQIMADIARIGTKKSQCLVESKEKSIGAGVGMRE